MFLLEVHFWSFLSIFDAEMNLSDANIKVHVVFLVRLKFSLRKETFWLRQFYMLAVSHKRIPFPNQEIFCSKWAKIY